jgi:hypothetical protein
LGEECYKKNQSLKAALENKIVEKLGKEQIAFLREILISDWGL